MHLFEFDSSMIDETNEMNEINEIGEISGIKEKPPVRLLVVEDVPALRQHLSRVIREIVPDADILEAENGKQGLRLARSIDPDLIIMDISMPELNGMRAAKHIWTESPGRKILFWSQYHRESYVRELGKIVPDEAIHGYVLKSEPDEKLSYAIRSVLLHDNPYIDPVVRGVQARLTSKNGALTDVECETLVDIAIGLTDKAIARKHGISTRGVQNRLSTLLEKLLKGEDTHLRESAGMEVFNPRTRLVYIALKRGLINTEDLLQPENEAFNWLDEEFHYVR